VGKQLPHEMNKNFQRIIQDNNIAKIIEANHEKENHLNLLNVDVSKKDNN
jgi:hypothetical protein